MASTRAKASTNRARAKAIRTTFQTAKFNARPDRLDFRDLRYAPPLRSLAPCWPDAADVRVFLPS